MDPTSTATKPGQTRPLKTDLNQKRRLVWLAAFDGVEGLVTREEPLASPAKVNYNNGQMPATRTARVQALKKVPLLADLSDRDLEFLASAALPRRCSAGELLFNEGDPCEGLFVVESGTVRVFKMSASGREQVLTVQGPGQSIAELPVFDGGNYPASAAANSDATLLLIQKRDFQSLCLTHPEVGLKVLKAVSLRLRGLVAMVEELSFSTVHHRLAAMLLREARDKGRRTSRGVEFNLEANNHQLASRIGTVRELVSRNLSRLQATGVIRMDGRTIIVPDLARLEAETEVSE